MTMKKSIRTFVILGFCMITACATTSETSVHDQPPVSWIGQFGGEDSHCLDFSITYLNEGERPKSSEKNPYDVFLSDAMFSRLPDGQLPDTVSLITDSETGRLSVTLIGKTSRRLQYEVICQSGWYMLEQASSGQYLGDGVVEKKSNQISYFRIGDQDELIVRVVVDAEFNSMYIFNSSIEAEEWYRFQPIPD